MSFDITKVKESVKKLEVLKDLTAIATADLRDTFDKHKLLVDKAKQQ